MSNMSISSSPTIMKLETQTNGLIEISLNRWSVQPCEGYPENYRLWDVEIELADGEVIEFRVHGDNLTFVPPVSSVSLFGRLRNWIARLLPKRLKD